MEDIEDFETNDNDHLRLISAVSKLDKTQHIKNPTRSEPTNLNSEFNLIKSSNKIDINDIVKVLGDTSHHVQISKNLKKTQDTSKVLPKPLEKPQAERIKRSTGFDETKNKIGRWDAVVARSRTVDYVVFPLKNNSTKLQPTQDYLSKLKSKSPLELELEEVDPPLQVEEENEEEVVYPMSYQEMVEHRQHLAKLRAQQSFKAAKAKHQSKIKSKKYHRILKKEKLKQQLKEFEDLQKSNPEEALKKLEALEKQRALERHTLRHKNTGKWAKSKMIRAKYDKEVRQQLAEQLAVSRNLTKKTEHDNSSEDDEEDNNETISDVTLSQDPMNPWILNKSDKSNIDAEYNFGYKKYLKDRMFKRKEESDSDSELGDDNKVNLLSESNVNNEEDRNIISVNTKNVLRDQHKPNKMGTVKVTATSDWIVETIDSSSPNLEETKPSHDISYVFESFESNLAGKVEKKLQSLRDNIKELDDRLDGQTKKKTKPDHVDEFNTLEYLQFTNQKKRAIIDEELNETTSKNAEDALQQQRSLKDVINHTNIKETTKANVDVTKFPTAVPTYLNTSLNDVENDLDQLDDDEQVVPKVSMEEVCEDDDLVANFRQEKEDEANKDLIKEVNTTLPGWGSWGGKGIIPRKRKTNRFITKGAPKMPRRDDNKGHIIIKEYKDPKLAAHKITEVPFPFTSVSEFEASIRAPLGNTFIPEKAHRKLIRPNVITKAGTIIDPMDEEELLIPRNLNYKNKSVIHLLAKNKRQT